jgi:hypothetical protein
MFSPYGYNDGTLSNDVAATIPLNLVKKGISKGTSADPKTALQNTLTKT